jgi:hypothetical protein
LNYSVDGQKPISMVITTPATTGNNGYYNSAVILPELSEGSHSMTVFGDLEITDSPSQGNYLANDTAYFTINAPSTLLPSSSSVESTNKPVSTPTSQTYLTIIYGLTAAVIIFAIGIIGLLIYFKKIKRLQH